MALDVCWNNLPSVVLLELFKNLSQHEKINASSTCIQWRKALFYSNFWQELSIDLHSEFDKHTNEKRQFLARSFLPSQKNVTVTISYANHFSSEFASIVNELATHRRVKRFILLCLDKPIWARSLRCCVDGLMQLIRRCRNLETMCLMHFWLQERQYLELATLLKQHVSTLRCLQLGLPRCKNKINITSLLDLSCFSQLTILNLDQSMVTDTVMRQLCNSTQLQRFVIHFGPCRPDSMINVSSWEGFRQSLPHCELRLNVINADWSIIRSFITPAMPATHLKILYCKGLVLSQMDELQRLKELRSVTCVRSNPTLNVYPGENPIIFMAWSCPYLEELTLIGMTMDSVDLIGVARLAGERLKKLNIPEPNVVKVSHAAPPLFWKSAALTPKEKTEFIDAMSKALERDWAPMDDKLNTASDPCKTMYNFLKPDYQLN